MSDLSQPNIQASYSALFDAMPGNCLLLQNDAPKYTILAVTSQHLKITGSKKESIGRGLFETYPSNPNDHSRTREQKLRDSLIHVPELEPQVQISYRLVKGADIQADIPKSLWEHSYFEIE